MVISMWRLGGGMTTLSEPVSVSRISHVYGGLKRGEREAMLRPEMVTRRYCVSMTRPVWMSRPTSMEKSHRPRPFSGITKVTHLRPVTNESVHGRSVGSPKCNMLAPTISKRRTVV